MAAVCSPAPGWPWAWAPWPVHWWTSIAMGDWMCRQRASWTHTPSLQVWEHACECHLHVTARGNQVLCFEARWTRAWPGDVGPSSVRRLLCKLQQLRSLALAPVCLCRRCGSDCASGWTVWGPEPAGCHSVCHPDQWHRPDPVPCCGHWGRGSEPGTDPPLCSPRPLSLISSTLPVPRRMTCTLCAKQEP
jgi:hypothetical protein